MTRRRPSAQESAEAARHGADPNDIARPPKPAPPPCQLASFNSAMRRHTVAPAALANAPLRTLRKLAKLTQKQAAKLLGITQGAVSDSEKRSNHVTLRTIFRYANAFRIRLLIGASTDPTPEEVTPAGGGRWAPP